MTQTAFLNPEAARARGRWYVVDAAEQVPGRLAAPIAALLRGKYDPMFTPHTGSGNHVVVINAEQIRVTGTKFTSKVYKRYSGYPGGLRQRTMEEQMATDPTQIIRHAVKGMLPHNSLGQQLCAHVHIYAGSAHPHQSQQPTPIQVTRLGVEGLRA